MKKISIVTPCFNEEENVEELSECVRGIMAEFQNYDYEHIFIDNSSTDQTLPKLRRLAANDPRIKVIVNARNFGHIRSPYYGLLQATGDAAILMASDFQDPPNLIKDFINKWEEGFKIVMGVKAESAESWILFTLRKSFYKTLARLSDINLVENFTGFGLYDQQIIQLLREINDPYPYFRGLIADIGFPAAQIEFIQPARKHGITKNNFYTLYYMAMLGLTNHSKVPLRLAAFTGMVSGTISFLVGMVYLIYKLLFWQSFEVGLAPLVVGLFFFASVQLFFLGIIGEYIGAIYTQVLKRPLVVEKERINF